MSSTVSGWDLTVRHQKGNQKTLSHESKGRYTTPEPIGCSKSSTYREIYSCNAYMRRRKVSNFLPPSSTGKRRKQRVKSPAGTGSLRN
jgi:hypothetical protein